MHLSKRLKYTWRVVKKAALDLNEDNCFRFSAALSFYTLFSIAPLILLTIYVAGIFADDAAVRTEIITQMRNLVGDRGVEGLEVLMGNLQREDQNIFSLALGIGILLFSATNIFIQLQISFNEIFQVRTIDGVGFKKLLYDRIISLGMILSLGFIMMTTLVLDAIVISLIKFLFKEGSELSALLLTIGENVILYGIATAVLYALFRFLPDVIIKNRFLWIGSAITTILIFLGKFLISWYIGNSNFSELSGASSSIIILMLWVYYSSVILFFGVELIKAQAHESDVYLPAARYAKKIKFVEVQNND